MAFPSLASAEDQVHLEHLQSEVTTLANTIARFEPVQLYAREELVDVARQRVAPNVQVVPSTAVDQLWIRDSGPTLVQDVARGHVAAIDFNFDYWGGKLPRTGDQTLASEIAADNGLVAVQARMVAEGGALEVAGDGTFLGVESCLINDNRNPGMTRGDVEAELSRLLGVSRFIWLKGVKDHELTDYHVDALARFATSTAEGAVVVLSKPGPHAPAPVAAAYEEARCALVGSIDATGRPLTVYDCQEPNLNNLRQPGDHDVVASYVNYYLVNGGLIMPRFGDDEPDEQAYALFQHLFPAREIVQVPLNALPRTGGGIHCATQQVPLFAYSVETKSR
jgi:agmatine deiminase